MSTREIHSVSDLNHLTRTLIEKSFPLIWVEGEISNMARPGSGHLYFTLKDEAAQVRCAMFRMKNRLLQFSPENGAQVLIRAKVSFYEARGEFQLIAEHMEPAGDGLLRQRFEQLKAKLAAEGLFDEDNKLEIPAFPRQLGIITSPTGAAVRDIIAVLGRRYPNLPLIIYPVAVQGTAAPAEIVQALNTASTRDECDLLIMARGGGSLEDLWAFNEEIVARAIYDCPIPIISGIGHEIDFTIADLVADLRAPTPSVAAELASPDRQECLQSLSHLHNRLLATCANKLKSQREMVTTLRRRLLHPASRLQQSAQRIDELEQRLQRAHRNLLQRAQAQRQVLSSRLMTQSPLHRIRLALQTTQGLYKRLQSAGSTSLSTKQQQLASLARALDAISPLATLHRGFAIVTKTAASDTKSEIIVRESTQLQPGEHIKVQLDKGKFAAIVESID